MLLQFYQCTCKPLQIRWDLVAPAKDLKLFFSEDLLLFCCTSLWLGSIAVSLGTCSVYRVFFFWSLQALKAAWSNGWLRRLDRYAAVCCSSTAPWLPSSSVSLVSQHTDRREQEIKATLHVTELHRKESRYQQRVEIMLPSNKAENKFCESLFSNWKEASISFFSGSAQVLTLGQALVILGYIRPKR